jgi:hypothetical protein
MRVSVRNDLTVHHLIARCARRNLRLFEYGSIRVTQADPTFLRRRD